MIITPGPWKAQLRYGEIKDGSGWPRKLVAWEVIEDKPQHAEVIISFPPVVPDLAGNDPRNEGVAKLFATTPDLLAELERLVLLIRSGEYAHRLQEEIASTQALIARAKGEA